MDSFDPQVRREALRRLAAAGPLPPPGGNVNMHLHSFFSYNARGWSPSHLAWAARQAGLHAAGLCDFDVLDGLEEFLDAATLVGLRATVNVETRGYLQEFADVEMTSPGEPGVTYLMGAGFVRPPAPGTPQAKTLAAYRDGARRRNVELVGRINAKLAAVAIDYERDVLPLAPAGAATERHIIRAYVSRSRQAFPAADAFRAFWAATLGLAAADMARIADDVPALEERVRSKLAKRGGLGYEQPTPRTFPPVGDFFAWVRSCGAIPMITWLDGTSAGEQAPAKMIECMRGKGAAALNIIPDRNWNFKSADERKLKTAKLREIVAVSESFGLPINIGTEMNRDGQPFVDDLAGEALRPHAEAFRRGAEVFVGHTWLLRYGGYSYVGAGADAEFGADGARKNAFFRAVGALPPPSAAQAGQLDEMGRERALAAMRDSAAKGRWTI